MDIFFAYSPLVTFPPLIIKVVEFAPREDIAVLRNCARIMVSSRHLIDRTDEFPERNGSHHTVKVFNDNIVGSIL